MGYKTRRKKRTLHLLPIPRVFRCKRLFHFYMQALMPSVHESSLHSIMRPSPKARKASVIITKISQKQNPQRYNFMKTYHESCNRKTFVCIYVNINIQNGYKMCEKETFFSSFFGRKTWAYEKWSQCMYIYIYIYTCSPNFMKTLDNIMKRCHNSWMEICRSLFAERP